MLKKNGEARQVVIDDFFPCSIRGKPVFSRAHGNELWVMILEKAWAKVHGSYERIESGWANNVMRDLTGAPAYTIPFFGVKEEDVWKTLQECD